MWRGYWQLGWMQNDYRSCIFLSSVLLLLLKTATTQRLSKGTSPSQQLHQVEEWHEQSKHRNWWTQTACNRMCTPGRRGSRSRSLTVLMPFVAWSNAQILKLNPISTTPKCRVHLSIASVKEWFSSALITMVTPPRAKNIWLLLLSNQARFPVIWAIAAKWLMAALHRSPGSARTCNEPSDVAISRWHGLTVIWQHRGVDPGPHVSPSVGCEMPALAASTVPALTSTRRQRHRGNAWRRQ